MNHLIAPQVIQFWEEKAKAYGPGVSGALFGAGWWFWVDACAASSVKIPFVQYLPGFFATLALIMTNCLRREDLEEYDSFDEGVYCRSRSWLFLAYLVSFGSIMGSVAVLLKSYALNDAIDVMWPGVAGLFQVTLILAAGLLLFVSRTPAEGTGSTNYGAF
ncbi:hypothetical protein WJX77_002012 [Trebouxia sp. C0004]